MSAIAAPSKRLAALIALSLLAVAGCKQQPAVWNQTAATHSNAALPPSQHPLFPPSHMLSFAQTCKLP